MFEIIVDFPVSAGALQDLKVRVNFMVNKCFLFSLVYAGVLGACRSTCGPRARTTASVRCVALL